MKAWYSAPGGRVAAGLRDGREKSLRQKARGSLSRFMRFVPRLAQASPRSYRGLKAAFHGIVTLRIRPKNHLCFAEALGYNPEIQRRHTTDFT
jgi:hypothetical protein